MKLFNNICNYIGENNFRIVLYVDMVDVINYDSIKEISSRRIIISSEKDIIIEGKNLSINKLLNKEVFIIGNIKSISINE